MTSPIVFPLALIKQAVSLSWNLSGAMASPGQTVAGAFPLLRLDGGGLWTSSADEIALFSDDDARAFRALRTAARNGAVPLILPCYDGLLPPYPAGESEATAIELVPHSDGTTFSDDSQYETSAIVVEVVTGAALRGTSLTLEIVNGSELRGGERFSILHPTQNWRMYEIDTVTIDDDGYSAVTFLPPLREAVSAGVSVEFVNLRCTMRLARTDAMNFTLARPNYPRHTVSFVETFLAS